MNFFRYKLIAPDGSIRSGHKRMTDSLTAITQLERDGSTVIFVKETGRLQTFLIETVTALTRKKLSRPSQAEVLRNMSLMLRSGVPLIRALEETAESSELPEISSDLKEIITGIKDGELFSESAEKFSHIFSRNVTHLIRIGEETGKLDKMLSDASDHITRIDGIISDTKQALMYPSFIFMSMGTLFLFWFYYVVPKMLHLFNEMNIPLPRLTQLLLTFSHFLQDHFLQLIAAIVVTAVTAATARKKNLKFRKATDTLLLRLPLSGTLISTSTLAFVTEYLSLLLNAGITLLDAISIMADSVKNEVYREKLLEVKEAIARGSGIAEAFSEAGIFPKFVTRMIGVGETSGTITEQLTHIAEEYRHRLSITVSTLGKMLEPVVLIVAGAMFALIIGGLLLPIYDLVSQFSV